MIEKLADITPPCISVCKTDPMTGYCYGCARSADDKAMWKELSTTNEWKEDNLIKLRNRLSGWQQDAFNESYKNKVATGKSLIMQKLADSKK